MARGTLTGVRAVGFNPWRRRGAVNGSCYPSPTGSRVTTRWEVTKALRVSELPAPARLVMFVLSDVAEVGTAEIPAQRSPSLSVLAKETGLDESTVKRHLCRLEADGWVVRDRPEQKAAQQNYERTRYRLLVPVGADNTQTTVQDEPSQGAESTDAGRTQRPPQGAHSARKRTYKPTDNPDQNHSSSENESPTADLRPDVELICTTLADRIEANGSNRPRITKAWRQSARLMLDNDGRSVEKVLKAIDWCQGDEFWRVNILSMPKLRDKYEQLRLAAARNGHARASPHQAYRNPTDDRAYSEGL